MKHIWTNICEQTIIDTETNLMSIINCIEAIRVPKKILEKKKEDGSIDLPLKLQVVSSWENLDSSSNNKGEVKLTLLSPGREVIRDLTHELVVPKQFKRMRDRINVVGITIKEEGSYKFVLSLKNEGEKDFEEVFSIPVNVSFEK